MSGGSSAAAPSVVATSVALPPHRYTQGELARKIVAAVPALDEKEAAVERFFDRVAVRQRHLALAAEDYAALAGRFRVAPAGVTPALAPARGQPHPPPEARQMVVRGHQGSLTTELQDQPSEVTGQGQEPGGGDDEGDVRRLEEQMGDMSKRHPGPSVGPV